MRDADVDSGNDRVYIHEFIDIRGHHRADYLQHMAANWSPLAQETRDQKLFGIWSLLGSTGAWPQVVNLWEERGFDGLARSFGAEAVGAGAQDPALERWWAAAAEFRSGGFDRLLTPAPWSPTIDDLCAANGSGMGAVAHAHELIRVRAGSNWELLDRVRTLGREVYAEHGMVLVGAFATAMVDDDECLLLWAIPTWAAWARFEQAHLPGGEASAGITEWRDRSRDIVTARHRILLIDGPLSPLRTGRQPSRADRRDWTD